MTILYIKGSNSNIEQSCHEKLKAVAISSANSRIARGKIYQGNKGSVPSFKIIEI